MADKKIKWSDLTCDEKIRNCNDVIIRLNNYLLDDARKSAGSKNRKLTLSEEIYIHDVFLERFVDVVNTNDEVDVVSEILKIFNEEVSEYGFNVSKTDFTAFHKKNKIKPFALLNYEDLADNGELSSETNIYAVDDNGDYIIKSYTDSKGRDKYYGPERTKFAYGEKSYKYRIINFDIFGKDKNGVYFALYDGFDQDKGHILCETKSSRDMDVFLLLKNTGLYRLKQYMTTNEWSEVVTALKNLVADYDGAQMTIPFDNSNGLNSFIYVPYDYKDENGEYYDVYHNVRNAFSFLINGKYDQSRPSEQHKVKLRNLIQGDSLLVQEIDSSHIDDMVQDADKKVKYIKAYSDICRFINAGVSNSEAGLQRLNELGMEYTVSVVRGKICVKMANALTRYDMMSSFECFNLMNPFSGVGVRTNQYFEPQVMDASNYESISYDLTMNNRRDKQFDIKSSHIYFNSTMSTKDIMRVMAELFAKETINLINSNRIDYRQVIDGEIQSDAATTMGFCDGYAVKGKSDSEFTMCDVERMPISKDGTQSHSGIRFMIPPVTVVKRDRISEDIDDLDYQIGARIFIGSDIDRDTDDSELDVVENFFLQGNGLSKDNSKFRTTESAYKSSMVARPFFKGGSVFEMYKSSLHGVYSKLNASISYAKQNLFYQIFSKFENLEKSYDVQALYDDADETDDLNDYLHFINIKKNGAKSHSEIMNEYDEFNESHRGSGLSHVEDKLIKEFMQLYMLTTDVQNESEEISLKNYLDNVRNGSTSSILFTAVEFYNKHRFEYTLPEFNYHSFLVDISKCTTPEDKIEKLEQLYDVCVPYLIGRVPHSNIIIKRKDGGWQLNPQVSNGSFIINLHGLSSWGDGRYTGAHGAELIDTIQSLEKFKKLIPKNNKEHYNYHVLVHHTVSDEQIKDLKSVYVSYDETDGDSMTNLSFSENEDLSVGTQNELDDVVRNYGGVGDLLSRLQIFDEDNSEKMSKGSPFIREMGKYIESVLLAQGVKPVDIEIDANGIVRYKYESYECAKGFNTADIVKRTASETDTFHVMQTGYIGPIIEPDVNGAIFVPKFYIDDEQNDITDGLQNEKVVILPGYLASVQAGRGNMDSRLICMGYKQFLQQAIKSVLQSNTTVSTNVGELNSSALWPVYKHLYSLDTPYTQAEYWSLVNAVDPTEKRVNDAILKTKLKAVRLMKRYVDDADLFAASYLLEDGPMNDLNRDALSLTRCNIALLLLRDKQCFDTDMTNLAYSQGGLLYLVCGAEVGDDCHVIPSDIPNDSSPLMALDELKYRQHQALERNGMAASNLLDNGRITKTGILHMTCGGWTMDDAYVISKEMAEKLKVPNLDRHGNKQYDRQGNLLLRPLKTGDKIMDCHGNKGVISQVIDKDIDSETAKRLGIEKLVELFKMNPDLQVVGSPLFPYGRFNGGVFAEFINAEKKDLSVNGIVVADGISYGNIIVTSKNVDVKSHIYDSDVYISEGKGRSASSQLSWAVAAYDADELYRYLFASDARSYTRYKAFLNATGYEISNDSTIDLLKESKPDSKVLDLSIDGLVKSGKLNINQSDLDNMRSEMSVALSRFLEKTRGKYTRYDNATGSTTVNQRALMNLRIEFEKEFVKESNIDSDKRREAVRLFELLNNNKDSLIMDAVNTLDEYDYLKLPFDTALASGTVVRQYENSNNSLLPILPSKYRSISFSGTNIIQDAMTSGYMSMIESIVNCEFESYLGYDDIVKTALDGIQNKKVRRSIPQTAYRAFNTIQKYENKIAMLVSEYNETVAAKFNGKNNITKRGLYGESIENSGTIVWVPNPNLKLNELGMTYDMAESLGIIPDKIIKMRGSKADKIAAFNKLEEKDKLAVVWRDPMLQKCGMAAMSVQLFDEDQYDIGGTRCVFVNAGIDIRFDGDFDGDSVAVVGLNKKSISRLNRKEKDALREAAKYNCEFDLNITHSYINLITTDVEQIIRLSGFDFAANINKLNDPATYEAAFAYFKNIKVSEDERLVDKVVLNINDELDVLAGFSSLSDDDKQKYQDIYDRAKFNAVCTYYCDKMRKLAPEKDVVQYENLSRKFANMTNDYVSKYICDMQAIGFSQCRLDYSSPVKYAQSLFDIVDKGVKGNHAKAMKVCLASGLKVTFDEDVLAKTGKHVVLDAEMISEDDSEWQSQMRQLKMETAFAINVKTRVTGVAGKYTQRGMVLARKYGPEFMDAILRISYGATQGILQAKHDADIAENKYQTLMTILPELYRGYPVCLNREVVGVDENGNQIFESHWEIDKKRGEEMKKNGMHISRDEFINTYMDICKSDEGLKFDCARYNIEILADAIFDENGEFKNNIYELVGEDYDAAKATGDKIANQIDKVSFIDSMCYHKHGFNQLYTYIGAAMFGNGLELLQPDSIEFDLPYEGLDLVKAYRGEKFTEDELENLQSNGMILKQDSYGTYHLLAVADNDLIYPNAEGDDLQLLNPETNDKYDCNVYATLSDGRQLVELTKDSYLDIIKELSADVMHNTETVWNLTTAYHADGGVDFASDTVASLFNNELYCTRAKGHMKSNNRLTTVVPVWFYSNEGTETLKTVVPYELTSVEYAKLKSGEILELEVPSQEVRVDDNSKNKRKFVKNQLENKKYQYSEKYGIIPVGLCDVYDTQISLVTDFCDKTHGLFVSNNTLKKQKEDFIATLVDAQSKTNDVINVDNSVDEEINVVKDVENIELKSKKTVKKNSKRIVKLTTLSTPVVNGKIKPDDSILDDEFDINDDIKKDSIE